MIMDSISLQPFDEWTYWLVLAAVSIFLPLLGKAACDLLALRFTGIHKTTVMSIYIGAGFATLTVFSSVGFLFSLDVVAVVATYGWLFAYWIGALVYREATRDNLSRKFFAASMEKITRTGLRFFSCPSNILLVVLVVAWTMFLGKSGGIQSGDNWHHWAVVKRFIEYGVQARDVMVVGEGFDARYAFGPWHVFLATISAGLGLELIDLWFYLPAALVPWLVVVYYAVGRELFREPLAAILLPLALVVYGLFPGAPVGSDLLYPYNGIMDGSTLGYPGAVVSYLLIPLFLLFLLRFVEGLRKGKNQAKLSLIFGLLSVTIGLFHIEGIVKMAFWVGAFGLALLYASGKQFCQSEKWRTPWNIWSQQNWRAWMYPLGYWLLAFLGVVALKVAIYAGLPADSMAAVQEFDGEKTTGEIVSLLTTETGWGRIVKPEIVFGGYVRPIGYVALLLIFWRYGSKKNFGLLSLVFFALLQLGIFFNPLVLPVLLEKLTPPFVARLTSFNDMFLIIAITGYGSILLRQLYQQLHRWLRVREKTRKWFMRAAITAIAFVLMTKVQALPLKDPVTDVFLSDNASLKVFQYLNDADEDAIVFSDAETTPMVVALTGRRGAILMNSFHGWARHTAMERLQDFDKVLWYKDNRTVERALAKYETDYILLPKTYDLSKFNDNPKLKRVVEDAKYVLYEVHTIAVPVAAAK